MSDGGPCKRYRQAQLSTTYFQAYKAVYGEKAEANEWGEGATTLEWAVASPAPWHTHEVLPDMTGKAPAE